jgi:hypothetical protein
MLENVLKKLDSISCSSDAELSAALNVAKMLVKRAEVELELPKKVEIWNGSLSCPTCGELLCPTDLCNDDFKLKNLNCKCCKQRFDWGLNLLDSMSL